VECKAHYPEDVLAGAFIGIVSSYIFTEKLHNEKLKNISFFITGSKNSQIYGFLFQIVF